MEVSRSLQSIEEAPGPPLPSAPHLQDLLILCLVNVINYCDRYTLATHLHAIQKKFEVKNDMLGLLQTTFIVFYMLLAPVFGYWGDRYTRKFIMAAGMILWNSSSLAASFVHKFWMLLLLRGLTGAGQAGFTTIAPTIISDLYVGDTRSKMLAVFYLAIPFGNGLGYIIGSLMAQACGSWEWSLRATPLVGTVAIVLVLLVLHEPKRGCHSLRHSSLQDDLRYLCRNRSFVFSTIGFTCIAFANGSLSWWGPKITLMGIHLQGPKSDGHLHGSIYGVMTAASGIVGLGLGYILSHRLRARYPKIDPLVCAVGLFSSVPFFVGLTYASTYNSVLCYFLLFVGQVMLNVNWAIICDILLYVVLPNRRSIAVGCQLLIGHGLGNAESPYLLGLLSDVFYEKIRDKGRVHDEWSEFRAMQYSFFVSCGVIWIGGLFFLLTSVYIVEDIKRTNQAVAGR